MVDKLNSNSRNRHAAEVLIVLLILGIRAIAGVTEATFFLGIMILLAVLRAGAD